MHHGLKYVGYDFIQIAQINSCSYFMKYSYVAESVDTVTQ